METTPTYLSWVWLYMRAVEAILLHSWKAHDIKTCLALHLTLISWSHTEFHICWTFPGYSSLSNTPTTWESVRVRPPPLDYAAAATWLSVPYHSFLVWKQSGNGLEKCNTCPPLSYNVYNSTNKLWVQLMEFSDTFTDDEPHATLNTQCMHSKGVFNPITVYADHLRTHSQWKVSEHDPLNLCQHPIHMGWH